MSRPRFIAFLRRLRTAEHGIAATEFALVLPLMAGAWLSMAQLAQLSEVSGKTSLAAQSLSDLATQPNPPLFSDLVNAVGQMFAPFPTDTTSLTVDEVGMTFNAGGTPTQNWRCTSGSNADATPLANLPSGFAPANQAVIMVTVKYTLPIRLLPTPTTYSVLPFPGIELAEGRGDRIASESEETPEGVEWVKAAIEPELIFVEVGL